MNTLTIFYLFSECSNNKSKVEDASTNFSELIVTQENNSEVTETEIELESKPDA